MSTHSKRNDPVAAATWLVIIPFVLVTFWGGAWLTVANAGKAFGTETVAAADHCANIAAELPTLTDVQDCRDAGWTVRPRLLVGPAGKVFLNRLPECRHEDGSGQRAACYWDASERGNLTGRDYWLDRRDRVHFVKHF